MQEEVVPEPEGVRIDESAKNRVRRVEIDYLTRGDVLLARKRAAARWAIWIGLVAASGLAGGSYFLPVPFNPAPSGLVQHLVRRLDRDTRDFFAERGCDACHESFHRPGVQQCADPSGACHSILADNAHHPFSKWGKDAAAALASSGSFSVWLGDKATCVACHEEHGGSLMPPPSWTPSSCGSCHGSDVPSSGRIESKPEVQRRVFRLAYNTFSHASHARVRCEECHQRRPEGAPGSGEAHAEAVPAIQAAIYTGQHSEFEPLTHETCMERCHGARGSRTNPSAPIFNVRWHGAEGGECLHCHKDKHSPALLEVASSEPALFSLKTRSHKREHDDVEKAHPGACVFCHRRGDEIAGGRVFVRKEFLHHLHVPGFDLTTDREGILSQCLRCHEAVAASSALPAAELYASAECASCHEAPPSDAKPVAANVPQRATGWIRFPHGKHRNGIEDLSGAKLSCLTCHFLEGGRRTTRADAETCSPCHDRTHRKIGGGDCAHCHRLDEDPATPDDPVYGGAQHPTTLPTWVRPVDPDFSHASRGHAEIDCTRCHHAAATNTTALSELRVPDESWPVCRGCHVDEKQRFHFR